MRGNNIKSIAIAVLFYLYIFNTAAFAQVAQNEFPTHTVYLKLKLSYTASVKVQPAPLKCNKHLAFSFTLDDGYRSAYLTAFPLLNGGTVSAPFPDEWKNDEGGDGSYSKGLFYSDGCKRDIPFKLAIAINAAGITDLPVNRGHLSWPEVKELYQAGWDVFNHGYHHSTKHGTDFDNEVLQNQLAVKKQLGFTMTQFIVPGGEADPGYEHQYEKSAFKYGSLSVGSINGAGPVISVKTPVNLSELVYRRNFLKSDSIPFAMIKQRLQVIDSLMKQPDPLWIHEFTHGVGNSNLWSLSVVFPEFKYYLTTLAEKYGNKGTDEIWMAPWQEVYEYIWLRDRIKITTTQKGKDVIIKLVLPYQPSLFRNHSTTLNIQTSSAFTVVTQSPSLKVMYNGKEKHKLINIDIANKKQSL